jgi:hypothetical protein
MISRTTEGSGSSEREGGVSDIGRVLSHTCPSLTTTHDWSDRSATLGRMHVVGHGYRCLHARRERAGITGQACGIHRAPTSSQRCATSSHRPSTTRSESASPSRSRGRRFGSWEGVLLAVPGSGAAPRCGTAALVGASCATGPETGASASRIGAVLWRRGRRLITQTLQLTTGSMRQDAAPRRLANVGAVQ